MYTVIIGSVGRYEFLIDLLSSLNKQIIKSNDIIVILDKNCKTNNKYQSLNKNFKNIKIIFENLNLSKKRNLGIKLAKNNIIFFSDDDDIWSPNKASTILPLFEKYDVVTHNFDKFGNQKMKSCSKLGKNDKILSKKYLLYGDNIFGGGSSIVAKKKILNMIKFNPNIKLSEDFDWWIRILLSNIKVFYVSKSLVSYRTHSSNMTKNLFRIYFSSITVSARYILNPFCGTFLFINSFLRNVFKILIFLPYKKIK